VNTWTVFRSSGSIAVQENLQRKDTTTTMVLGHKVYNLDHRICSGEGGSFTTIRSGKRSMVVKHRSPSGLHRSGCLKLLVIKGSKSIEALKS
jgi:hypothetical protein